MLETTTKLSMLFEALGGCSYTFTWKNILSLRSNCNWDWDQKYINEKIKIVGMACWKVCKQNSKSTWWHHFLLRREEKERVTPKNLKISVPHLLRVEHTFTQVCSSTVYNLTMHCYPCNQQDVSTPSLPGKFYLHRSGCRPFLMRGIQAWHVEEDHVAFQSNSWATPWLMHGPYPTDKPLTRLFGSYVHSRFTHTPATIWPDVLL